MVPKLHWRRIVAAGEAFHVARATKTPKNPTALHTHDFAEVFWVEEGSGRHRFLRGEQPLEPGDLVFIHPTDVHGIEGAPLLRFTNVAFPMETYRLLRDRYFNADECPWGRRPPPRVFRLDPPLLRQLGRAADDLFAAPRTRLFIESFLLNLVCRLQATGSPRLPPGSPDWLRHACAVICRPENLRGGAAAFARLAGRSPEHVARATRRWLGETPSDYVNRVRMRYASRQLAMSDAKIQDVAWECGIGNLSHFYRVFRRHFNTSPGDFREQHHGFS
jgi:AraC family cel operon transcriptional repressor